MQATIRIFGLALLLLLPGACGDDAGPLSPAQRDDGQRVPAQSESHPGDGSVGRQSGDSAPDSGAHGARTSAIGGGGGTTGQGTGDATAPRGSSTDSASGPGTDGTTPSSGGVAESGTPTPSGPQSGLPSGSGPTTPPSSAPSSQPPSTPGGGGALTPLSPDVAVPPEENEACDVPGSMAQCSGIAVCRHFAAEESRCESCTACGNLNALCTRSEECDILFTCFQGRCTAACSFETPQTCGIPTDCTDVGHPTHGICLPS